MDFLKINQKFKKCLVVVDYQYDFVATDGILTAGESAQKIEQNIYNLVLEYLKNEDLVIFTIDEHKLDQWYNHPESKSFQIHCQENHKGSEPYGKLKEFLEDERVFKLKKSAFLLNCNQLEKIVETCDEVLLTGVVTDICVLQNAIGLYNIAANTNKKVSFSVKEDACASFNNDGHKYAINYMKDTLGFNIL